ncbi:hypothetical protein BAE44_0010458, partial [Dichanthelium oligosanthes]
LVWWRVSGSSRRTTRVVWEVRPDALAGRDVEEAAAAGADVGLFEHDPLPREKAGVQAAPRVRVHRAQPPRPARGAEADVVGHVVGEGEVGGQAGRPVTAKARPVPCASAAAGTSRRTTPERGARALTSPCRRARRLGGGGASKVISRDWFRAEEQGRRRVLRRQQRLGRINGPLPLYSATRRIRSGQGVRVRLPYFVWVYQERARPEQ